MPNNDVDPVYKAVDGGFVADPGSTKISVGWSLALAAASLFLGVVLWLAYHNQLPVQWLQRIPRYDKLGHFVLIGGAAWLAYRASGRRMVRLGRASVPLGPVVVLAVAFVEEGFQILSPHRSFSVSDLAANVLGAAFWVGLDMWWARRSAMPPVQEDPEA
mgnify:CR=1 FL=1